MYFGFRTKAAVNITCFGGASGAHMFSCGSDLLMVQAGRRVVTMPVLRVLVAPRPEQHLARSAFFTCAFWSAWSICWCGIVLTSISPVTHEDGHLLYLFFAFIACLEILFCEFAVRVFYSFCKHFL